MTPATRKRILEIQDGLLRGLLVALAMVGFFGGILTVAMFYTSEYFQVDLYDALWYFAVGVIATLMYRKIIRYNSEIELDTEGN